MIMRGKMLWRKLLTLLAILEILYGFVMSACSMLCIILWSCGFPTTSFNSAFNPKYHSLAVFFQLLYLWASVFIV